VAARDGGNGRGIADSPKAKWSGGEMKSHKGASQGERKSGQFAFGSWPVLRDGENKMDSKGPALWRGPGLA